jgi:hypothetical protein
LAGCQVYGLAWSRDEVRLVAVAHVFSLKSCFRLKHAAFARMCSQALHGVTLEQLQRRRRLLQGFDALRLDLDASGTLAGMDACRQRALGIVTSSWLGDALGLSREGPRGRGHYGPGDPGVDFDAAPRLTEHFLLARRLVEAGARFVALAFGSRDWHEKDFEGLRRQAPPLGPGLSALVEDRHERGLRPHPWWLPGAGPAVHGRVAAAGGEGPGTTIGFYIIDRGSTVAMTPA